MLHLVAHDQLLRDALGGVGRGPAVSFLMISTGAAGDLAAVFLQVQRHAGVELTAVVGVGAE